MILCSIDTQQGIRTLLSHSVHSRIVTDEVVFFQTSPTFPEKIYLPEKCDSRFLNQVKEYNNSRMTTYHSGFFTGSVGEICQGVEKVWEKVPLKTTLISEITELCKNTGCPHLHTINVFHGLWPRGWGTFHTVYGIWSHWLSSWLLLRRDILQ